MVKTMVEPKNISAQRDPGDLLLGKSPREMVPPSLMFVCFLTPVTMHVFGVDTGVGDWGNQDKETREHKKDCFRI